jgi:diaminopimelate decarboxylase
MAEEKMAVDLISTIRKFGTPIYVYDRDEIRRNYELIEGSIPYANKQIHYAVMCNSHGGVLAIIRDLGGSVQINSLHELGLVQGNGFAKERIAFTSTGLDAEILEVLVRKGIQVNLDSVEETEKYCRLNPGGKFGIRLRMRDIKLPEWHTNSPKDSDAGIAPEDFEKVKEIAEQHGCMVNGVHGYLASNILDPEPFIQASNYIAECAGQFPDLEYANFGGGFGIPDRPTEAGFDFRRIGAHYSMLTRELSDCLGREVQLKIEPGRAIVATAGTLYAKVANVKRLEGKKQIVVDAGFAEFARPRIYGAYHEIVAVGKEGETELCDIRGNTVLQSDFLGRDRQLPKVGEGDILAIKNAGAYGAAMASGFPGKERPKEIFYCD